MKFQNLLVPTDFSENAEHALRVAIELAKPGGGKIFLLHVVEPTASAPLALAGVVPEGEMIERLESSARASLKKAAEQHGGEARIEPLVAVGSPAVEITRCAKDNKVDAIVTSTHGRTGLAHLLMGSVAERIVRTSEVPVLVVPAEHQK